jgi:hypothetical protein
MLLILLACLVVAGAWLVKAWDPAAAATLDIVAVVLFLIGALRWLGKLPLLLLACALGASGAIGEFAGLWNSATAWWINIAGGALFLIGILRWLGGEKRGTRNWKSDGDMVFPPPAAGDAGNDGAWCGSSGGTCDSGGDGGGGGD